MTHGDGTNGACRSATAVALALALAAWMAWAPGARAQAGADPAGSGSAADPWEALLARADDPEAPRMRLLLGAEGGLASRTAWRGEAHVGDEERDIHRHAFDPRVSGPRLGLRVGLTIRSTSFVRYYVGASFRWLPGAGRSSCDLPSRRGMERYCEAGIKSSLGGLLELQTRLYGPRRSSPFFVGLGMEIGAYAHVGSADWDHYEYQDGELALEIQQADFVWSDLQLGVAVLGGVSFDESRDWSLGLRAATGLVDGTHGPYVDVTLFVERAL